MYNVVFEFIRLTPEGIAKSFRGRVKFRLKQKKILRPIEIIEDPKFIPAISKIMSKKQPGKISDLKIIELKKIEN